MTRQELKASMTVEMAVIVPIIVFVFMGFVMTLFYYHDKNIIYGTAYEVAVAGSADMRRKDPVTEEDLEIFCKERLRGKCIFMTSQNIDVTIQKEKIIVRISSARRGYRLQIEKEAPVTKPEKKIRDIRRLDI